MLVVEETAALLNSLRGIWDEVVVDELTHALQAAARAIDDGADDELVLAAALHDLGHSPRCAPAPGARPAGHDQVARDWLTPRYGQRVGWLAGTHVAAKRHLVATDPDYAGGLSEVSRASLYAQGGAGVDPALIAHPWWRDALRLRHYDDAAKDPAGTAVTIDEVLDVARRVRRAAR
ncbi:HD family phosphohydrolase [Mycolicibacterium thermoresistibile]